MTEQNKHKWFILLRYPFFCLPCFHKICKWSVCINALYQNDRREAKTTLLYYCSKQGNISVFLLNVLHEKWFPLRSALISSPSAAPRRTCSDTTGLCLACLQNFEYAQNTPRKPTATLKYLIKWLWNNGMEYRGTSDRHYLNCVTSLWCACRQAGRPHLIPPLKIYYRVMFHESSLRMCKATDECFCILLHEPIHWQKPYSAF